MTRYLLTATVVLLAVGSGTALAQQAMPAAGPFVGSRLSTPVVTTPVTTTSIPATASPFQTNRTPPPADVSSSSPSQVAPALPAPGTTLVRSVVPQGSSQSPFAPSAFQRTLTAVSITDLQSRLASVGIYRGPVNGQLTAATRASIRLLQEQGGLLPTGEIDAQTAQLLGLGTTATTATQSSALLAPPQPLIPTVTPRTTVSLDEVLVEPSAIFVQP